MPVVLRHKANLFYLYSNAGLPPEPMHVHVRRGRATAKLWLEPDVSLAASDGLPLRVLRELARAAREHKGLLAQAWRELHHG